MASLSASKNAQIRESHPRLLSTFQPLFYLPLLPCPDTWRRERLIHLCSLTPPAALRWEQILAHRKRRRENLNLLHSLSQLARVSPKAGKSTHLVPESPPSTPNGPIPNPCLGS
jgi:hypothetical protein